jgi:hypothetical protein
MAHKSDAEIVANTHNTARFFTENRQIAWVALLLVVGWGMFAYEKMPKRKDPDIPVREAQAICLWPGINAARVEQLVTRKIEEKVAEISEIQGPNFEYFGVRSLTLDGMSVVNIQIDERYPNVQQIFNDVDLKLRQITNLPQGAGPIQFFSDFGDTAALMLTVASPRESAVAISLRALAIRQTIIQARARFASETARTTIVLAFPQSLVVPNLGERVRGDLAGCLNRSGAVSELVAIEGYGFVGLDGLAPSANAYLMAAKRCVMAASSSTPTSGSRR